MPFGAISELIGLLYDAAADARLWTGIAARLATTFDSTSAVVKFHSPDGAVQVHDMTGNLVVPDPLQDWAEDWHRRDLWVARTMAHGMGRIVTSEMLVTPEEQQKSAFYLEWLAQLDIHHLIGATFPTGDGAVGVLGIHRPIEASPYDDLDRRRAALLLPHLQRAVQLGRHLSKLSLTQAVALDALDHLDTGVMVLDRMGRILQANAAASALLGDSRVCGVRHGCFQLDDALLQARFTQLLRAALAAGAGQPAPQPRDVPAAPDALVIPRADRLPLTLALAPWRPGWVPGFDPGPMALVFLKDPERPGLHLDRLRALFSLTPTEAAIAAELGAGRSLAEITRRLNIGLSTARWHLKSILSKTGTTRQAEAAALLARSVATLPTRD